MVFNSQKFLEALFASQQRSNSPAVDFASLMAGGGFSMPFVNENAIATQHAKEEQERQQGFLSKTFEYLLTPMHTVQNTIADISQGVKGEDSLGQTLQDIGVDLAAGTSGIISPVVEAASPGFNLPGEEWNQKFIEENVNEFHGTGEMSGSRLLEDVIGWKPDSTLGKVGKGFAGFGLDVALDPLTYVPFVGIGTTLTKAGVKGGAKVAEELTTKAATGSAKAFTKPTIAKEGIEAARTPDILQSIGSLTPTQPVTKGFNLGASKAFKRAPEEVTMNWAKTTKVNPLAVREAITKVVERGPLTQKIITPEATGDFKVLAEKAAESYFQKMGKTASGVIRQSALKPANQANLYNNMYKAAAKYLAANPQIRRGGPELPRNQRFLRERAVEMMKVAENYIRKTYGVQGQAVDGTGLSLTNVLEHLGDNKVLDEHVTSVLRAFSSKNANEIDNPVAKAAFEAAIAERSVKTGIVTQQILDNYSRLASQVKQSYSPAAYMKWKKADGVPAAAFNAGLSGASSKEVDRIVNIVKNHVAVDGIEHLEPYQVLNALSKSMIEEVSKGNIDAKLMHKLNKAFIKATGKTSDQLAKDISGYGVLDEFNLRFSTWAGRHADSKHLAAAGYGALEWAARSRAQWFANVTSKYSKEEIAEAWRLAVQRGPLEVFEAMAKEQGVQLGTARTRALSGVIRDYLDNLIGPHSTAAKVEDLMGSAVMRSMTTRADLDKQLGQLGSAFRFSDYVGRKSNTFNLPADYSGDNWIFALENVDPTKMGQDPMNFLYDLDLAVERVMTEYAVIDSFAGRFGKQVGEAGYDPLVHRYLIPHHRLEGYRFDTEIGKQFMRLMSDMEKGPWMPKSKIGREFVRGTGTWKRGVTIYNPAHHLRNLNGDSWLMWMSGINDPRVFGWAKKVIHSQRENYKEVLHDPTLDRLRGLLSKEEFGWGNTEGKSVILNRNGAGITAEEISAEMMQRGLLKSANQIEDIVGVTKYFPGHLENLRGATTQRAHNLATKTAEYREHFVRIAHFTGEIDKGLRGKTGRALAKKLQGTTNIAERRAIMEDIYEHATRQVSKWHPDGRDLTQFEQKYMRNIIPFYAWQRKSLPLILEGMVKRPAKLTAYPKATFALQQMLGIDAPSMSEPFPLDQIYPNFMLAGGVGPIGDPESDNPVARFFGTLGRNYINPISGQEQGYTVIDPGNPFNDFMDTTVGFGNQESVKKGIWSMLHPGISMPVQAMSDETPIGAPISEAAGGEGYAPWAVSNVPILSMLQRIFEVGEDKAPNTEPGVDTQSLINMLTALGIQGSGQYRKSAEFDAKDFAKSLMESQERGGR